MTDKTSRLKSLNNKKLIDVVKNYRQYGYDDNLRDAAIIILDERGIDKELLKLTGNFENTTYDSAERLYKVFRRNSKIAFILYVIILITNIFVSIPARNSEILSLITIIINWSALLGYFVFLIKTFINQSSFFKTIGKDFDSSGALMYLFLGMPFYILMYFYFRNQMNIEMKLIK